jgi:TRAP-type C4-dicarboxylate transport system permease small subunit
MTSVHVALGTALIVANALAFLWGGVQWWRGAHSQVFWPLLRIGQALVVIEAIDGGVLVLEGRALPNLHLIYGLVPLAVSFVAEQLRLAAADQVLAQRGLEGRADVERLATADQHELVRAILRRELGVMTASAGVVVLLALRAAQVF